MLTGSDEARRALERSAASGDDGSALLLDAAEARRARSMSADELLSDPMVPVPWAFPERRHWFPFGWSRIVFNGRAAMTGNEVELHVSMVPRESWTLSGRHGPILLGPAPDAEPVGGVLVARSQEEAWTGHFAMLSFVLDPDVGPRLSRFWAVRYSGTPDSSWRVEGSNFDGRWELSGHHVALEQAREEGLVEAFSSYAADAVAYWYRQNAADVVGAWRAAVLLKASRAQARLEAAERECERRRREFAELVVLDARLRGQARVGRATGRAEAGGEGS